MCLNKRFRKCPNVQFPFGQEQRSLFSADVLVPIVGIRARAFFTWCSTSLLCRTSNLKFDIA